MTYPPKNLTLAERVMGRTFTGYSRDQSFPLPNRFVPLHLEFL